MCAAASYALIASTIGARTAVAPLPEVGLRKLADTLLFDDQPLWELSVSFVYALAVGVTDLDHVCYLHV
ncbi:hypothetical protein DAH61_16505, partial [Sphingomonas koreensis]